MQEEDILNGALIPNPFPWGTRTVDCEIESLPKNMVANAFLTDIPGQLRIALYRWDKDFMLGWDDPVPVTLSFPSGSKVEVEVPPSVRLEDGHSHLVDIPGLELEEKLPQQDRLIPRILWNISRSPWEQPFDAMRQVLANNKEINQTLHPGFRYYILNDEACTRLVEQAGVEGFTEAYNSVRSGSYRADMVRYYLLYKYGGIYMDDKSMLRVPLDSREIDSLFHNISLFLPVLHMQKNIEIAFMAAKPGMQVFLEALQKSIENIRNRVYLDSSLAITGNRVFTPIVKERYQWTFMGYPDIINMMPIYEPSSVIMENDKVFWNRQPIHIADIPNRDQHYSNLWLSRQIYVDGNPEPPVWNQCRRYLNVIVIFTFLLGIVAVGFVLKRYPSMNRIHGEG